MKKLLYRGRTDDGYAFLVGHLDHLSGLSFRNALSYDSDGVDLKQNIKAGYVLINRKRPLSYCRE